LLIFFVDFVFSARMRHFSTHLAVLFAVIFALVATAAPQHPTATLVQQSDATRLQKRGLISDALKGLFFGFGFGSGTTAANRVWSPNPSPAPSPSPVSAPPAAPKNNGITKCNLSMQEVADLVSACNNKCRYDFNNCSLVSV
jgi:hypothetical protein